MIDTILFDLDGTLLPMEEKEFVECYLGYVVKRFAPQGFDGDAIIKAIWEGVKSMMLNDGSVSNKERFWDTFLSIVPDEGHSFRDQIDDFYVTDFEKVKKIVTGPFISREIIDCLKGKGYRLVLATNPLFPPCAVNTRLGWMNLSIDDFSYVTTYDNSSLCKPNPAYFTETLKACHLSLDQCMMVGNNTREDLCVRKLKEDFPTYLITDHLINPEGISLENERHGSLEDFLTFARALPDINKSRPEAAASQAEDETAQFSPLVLASASPRRRELMGHLNRPFDIVVSDVDEVITKSDPADVVKELSFQKAENVAGKVGNGSIVIGADTVVACDGKILGKPGDEAEAFSMLKLLSGRTHSVFTGVTLYKKSGEIAKTESFAAETRVTFYPLSDKEINDYIASKDPMDKAGAYGIQTGAAIFVKSIEGDYNNVVGLPVSALYQKLKIFE